jgi:hypothetical protein
MPIDLASASQGRRLNLASRDTARPLGAIDGGSGAELVFQGERCTPQPRASGFFVAAKTWGSDGGANRFGGTPARRRELKDVVTAIVVWLAGGSASSRARFCATINGVTHHNRSVRASATSACPAAERWQWSLNRKKSDDASDLRFCVSWNRECMSRNSKPFSVRIFPSTC